MASSLPRRIAIGIGVAVAAVVVLLVALVLLVNSGVATKRAVDLVLPSVSKALGRDVTLKGADLKIFPNARVRLAGVEVAGPPGEPPLAALDSIDVEVRHIIDVAYAQASSTITAHRDALDRVAQALQEHGSLRTDELQRLIGDQVQ